MTSKLENLPMPTKTEIQSRILDRKNLGQDTVRRSFLKRLNKFTKIDTILYASAFLGSGVGKPYPPFLLNLQLQDIQGFMTAVKGLSGDKLDLILHSPGGGLEAAEQIVNYLRSKYKYIRAIIPQNAMSAATMIACAADEIVMGRQSAIGPIDPQLTFPTQNGPVTTPAQALLDEFELAKKEVSSNPATAVLWLGKLKDYPPGIIQVASDTVNLAKEKVAHWLRTYMFANDTAASDKAKQIADWLGDAHLHKTHGHPISFDEAIQHGLIVKRLEDDPELQDMVLSVYHATTVTFEVTSCIRLIENHLGKGVFFKV